MSKFNLSKNVNKKYYVLVLIALLGIVSIYIGTSYGLFKRVDFLTNVDFVAGTLDYKIENDELNNNSIVVGSGNQHELTLTLTSLNTVDSKYELYYLIDGKKVTNNDIEIGYTSESVDSVKGTIDANKTKKITVSIKNNSSKAVTITFGCEGGLINNTLVMSKGNSLDNLILNGDVMLAYTYSGTGTKPNKFPDSDDGYYVTDLTCTGGTAVWDNDTWSMKITSTTAESLSCNATVVDIYQDESGAAYPELQGDLVPVKISNTGVVTKANIHQEWYDYNESVWANAVILTDNAPELEAGDTIEEQYIESYFVWIPRYKYKIFDEGKYTSLASKTAAEQPIVIEFETKTTAASTGTSEGTWLTHPAFTTLDVNGIWVGKFESGYNGATTTAAAQQDVADKTKLIIKPNVYSWRNITVGNAFKTSYEYNRDLDSHMMKNTEWGAVAYLSHSEYGNLGETGNGFSLRINNNSAFITGYSATEEPTVGYNKGTSREGNRVESTAIGVDGTYTVNYLNTSSVISSTTGNYSGVYDMSGGAWEYVMGYTTASSIGVGGSSGMTSLFSDFFTNNQHVKYYDKYTSTDNINYNNRILGDATGEMGPFFSLNDPDGISRNRSGWYGDFAYFPYTNFPWFYRGCYWRFGNEAGAFAFSNESGGKLDSISFRVVLAPDAQ